MFRTSKCLSARPALTAALLGALTLVVALPATAAQDATTPNTGATNATAMSPSKTGETSTAREDHTAAGLQMSDQSVAGRELLVRSADLPDPGWIVIHYRNKDGQLSGDPIGTLHLSAGHYENITVTLNAPVKAGETLVAMLHSQGPGDDETYGDAATHHVIKKADGEPAKAEFEITKPADEKDQPVAASSGAISQPKQ